MKMQAIEISTMNKVKATSFEDRLEAMNKALGTKKMESLERKLIREHKAFCIKHFGRKIWHQTNVGWFQSRIRWESKHYNGFVTISEIDEQGKVTNKVVPYLS